MARRHSLDCANATLASWLLGLVAHLSVLAFRWTQLIHHPLGYMLPSPRTPYRCISPHYDPRDVATRGPVEPHQSDPILPPPSSLRYVAHPPVIPVHSPLAHLRALLMLRRRRPWVGGPLPMGLAPLPPPSLLGWVAPLSGHCTVASHPAPCPWGVSCWYLTVMHPPGVTGNRRGPPRPISPSAWYPS